MCDTIAELLRRDPRSGVVTVDTYRRPSIERRGRYPDVYVELDRLGKFAIEVQLAKPFAPEIAARHLHYEAEGVSLIWVFRELPSELPQGFHDVITLQRGNAFLFDDAAFVASNRRGTLALTAMLENDRGGFLKPREIVLDDLDRSTGRSVFLEDRRSERLLAYCKAGREKWWEAFKRAPPCDVDYPFEEPCFIPAWDSIKGFVPELRPWKRHCWEVESTRGDRLFVELAAILFSIARTAMVGKDRVYLTRFTDSSALTSMLNAKLSAHAFMPFATLIETMLAATPARDRLERISVSRSLELAKQRVDQVRPGHPVWAGATRLFPEVLDGLLRAELIDLARLPAWAAGSTADTLR